MKIFVSGSLAYDRIMDFPGYFKDNILPNKIHILNVSFFIQDLKTGFGGTAGNIAYNLSLLGIRPTVLGNVGNDFGPYRKRFTDMKIDQRNIKLYRKEVTAAAYIITDKDDNQIAGFYPGAGKHPFVLKQKTLAKDSLAIIAADNTKNFLTLATAYKKENIPYIFDPGQQVVPLNGSQLKRLINGARVFISNDYEINLVIKKTGWNLSQLQSKVDILVTTLGPKGSMLYQAGKKTKVKAAKPKKIVDPTGAGDAYRAGFIYGMLKDLTLKKCGQLASTTAVYAVERYGTQAHTYSIKSIKSRYKSNFSSAL